MATQTKFTVNDVLQIMSDLRGESSVNTSANRIRMVSNAYGDYSNRMFWRTHLLRSQTQTANGSDSDFSVGSTTYPMRPKGLTEVFVGGTTEAQRHQIVDYNKFRNLYNRDNSVKVVYEWYDAVNDLWKMHINPTPASGDVITYSYYWTSPELTSTSDSIICYDINIIAQMALATLYHSEDELQKEQLANQTVENLMSEWVGRENGPAVNQVYVMDSIENSVNPHGIGTY